MKRPQGTPSRHCCNRVERQRNPEQRCRVDKPSPDFAEFITGPARGRTGGPARWQARSDPVAQSGPLGYRALATAFEVVIGVKSYDNYRRAWASSPELEEAEETP